MIPVPAITLLREELESRVHAAIAQLGPHDREILVMRDLEAGPRQHADAAGRGGLERASLRTDW